MQQFVPWFLKWGLIILCKVQIFTLQRCGFKIPFHGYSIAQSNKRSIAGSTRHNSTGITLSDEEKNNTTDIHQDDSELILDDSCIHNLDNYGADCDEISRDLHTKSVVNAKSNCPSTENRLDGDIDQYSNNSTKLLAEALDNTYIHTYEGGDCNETSRDLHTKSIVKTKNKYSCTQNRPDYDAQFSNHHKSLQTTALNSCAESRLNSIHKALITSNQRVRSHTSTIATTQRGSSISTRIDTTFKEFSLKRKRSGYSHPNSSLYHIKEKPVYSTRTIGIVNADIVVSQTSEKDPWDFFPATSTIARSKQYGKLAPISPLTDSSHSV